MDFASPQSGVWILLAVFCCATAGFDNAWANAAPGGEVDPETTAALARLRSISPFAQAAVLEEMASPHHRGELTSVQVPLLAGLVTATTWTVDHRRKVAFLLALQGEPGRKALDKLSFSPDATIRETAIEALRFHSLVERTRAEDDAVRRQAVAELPAYADMHPAATEATIAALAAAYTRRYEPQFAVRLEALRGLRRFGPRAAPVIVQSFENAHPAFLQYGAAALLAMGDDAEDMLLAGLRNRDPLVRQRCILVLAEKGLEDESAAAIASLESDPDPLVQKAASRIMAAYRDTTRGQ